MKRTQLALFCFFLVFTVILTLQLVFYTEFSFMSAFELGAILDIFLAATLITCTNSKHVSVVVINAAFLILCGLSVGLILTFRNCGEEQVTRFYRTTEALFLLMYFLFTMTFTVFQPRWYLSLLA